jgi:hypothetical protein
MNLASDMTRGVPDLAIKGKKLLMKDAPKKLTQIIKALNELQSPGSREILTREFGFDKKTVDLITIGFGGMERMGKAHPYVGAQFQMDFAPYSHSGPKAWMALEKINRDIIPTIDKPKADMDKFMTEIFQSWGIGLQTPAEKGRSAWIRSTKQLLQGRQNKGEKFITPKTDKIFGLEKWVEI